MGWQEAGLAWGARATDWAELMEPHFGPVYEGLADAIPIQPGMRVLDVGCGAGLGLSVYATRGAVGAGIDAAEALLDFARTRVPDADLKHGTMLDLPWPDGYFDAVLGVNSFVYADDGALAEAHRVLRPGGTLALGYWTDPGDFIWAMSALGAALEPYVSAEDTNIPLRMADPELRVSGLTNAGFSLTHNGTVDAVTTFRDPVAAYDALASTGMIQPIVAAGAEDELKARTMEWLQQRPEPKMHFGSTFGITTAART